MNEASFMCAKQAIWWGGRDSVLAELRRGMLRLGVGMWLARAKRRERIDGLMDGWIDGLMDGWMDGWTDGWMDGLMDGWKGY